jgi:hypothetical protein
MRHSRERKTLEILGNKDRDEEDRSMEEGSKVEAKCDFEKKMRRRTKS